MMIEHIFRITMILWTIVGFIHCMDCALELKFEKIKDPRKKVLLVLLQGPGAWVCGLIYALFAMLMMLWTDYLKGVYDRFMNYLMDIKEEEES